MLSLGQPVRVYLAPGSTDMRKSFDALTGLVATVLEANPLSGHVFAFCNRRRTQVKLLVWDGTGLWVHAKRLAKGTFAWPHVEPGQARVELEAEQLSWILGGLDLSQAKRRTWWRRTPGLLAS